MRNGYNADKSRNVCKFFQFFFVNTTKLLNFEVSHYLSAL